MDTPSEVASMYSLTGTLEIIAFRCVSRLSPKATVAVPVKINLLGRFGDFTNKIKVKTDADETYEVDVEGKIVNDLWITESSLRCTAESGQPAKGLLEIHTVDYHDVKFDFTGIDKRLTVTEIARNTADGETVIKFDVAVDTKDDTGISLTLTSVDSKIVPLTVPVYCYSNETPMLAPVLQTKTIALGTVTGRQHEVSVYGDTDLMSVIKQAEFIGSPEGVTVKILTSDNSDVLRLSFQFSDRTSFITSLHKSCSRRVVERRQTSVFYCRNGQLIDDNFVTTNWCVRSYTAVDNAVTCVCPASAA
ncbi:hypothetical protein FACS189454_02930 [Planctomycetales bacterium]|nr:hypothetical protein FACS189454_02930 [Planctomycetales bacterium]